MDAGATANRRWSELLAGWAIPEELLTQAPECPYVFEPRVFIAAANAAVARAEDSPSDAVARQALPEGGTVLDVGAGAGAASLRLAGRASELVAVDQSRELLEAFSTRAAALGVGHREVEGHWPEVAHETPAADVVVCHHVLYNVADLVAFISALSSHANRRVVVELTAAHPLVWMAPYWKALHGWIQPDRPVADDALEVLASMGLDVHERRWQKIMQMLGEGDDEALARIARRLCLPPDRYGELQQEFAATPPPRERQVVTAWWDTGASS